MNSSISRPPPKHAIRECFGDAASPPLWWGGPLNCAAHAEQLRCGQTLKAAKMTGLVKPYWDLLSLSKTN